MQLPPLSHTNLDGAAGKPSARRHVMRATIAHRCGATDQVARRRKTQLFNGYEPQVASLYAGMDLRRFF